MNRVAKFEKVSFERFKTDLNNCFPNFYKNETVIRDIYNNIELPTRATYGSAGYDFKIPFFLLMDKNQDYLIPTGIRCKIDEGWVLKIYPKSGLGTKYGFELINTVGIIDSDYYNSDNEGHILTKIKHTQGQNYLEIHKGKGFVQGMFVPYGITKDDSAEGIRNGGFGSTDEKH